MNYNSVEVLLVEDNMEDAEMTIRELKRNNMANNLFHVKDGEEALEFIFAEGKYADSRDLLYKPKVILLDIQMPKVNGIEVLQKVKADLRTSTTPVVILTSSKDLVKPVNFEGFAAAIRNLGFYWLLLNQRPV